MSELDLENLKKNKNEILKAEIGSLLFNLGKTHIGFWDKKKECDEEKKETVYFSDLKFDKDDYGYDKFAGYRDYFNDKDDKDGKCPFDIDVEKSGGNLKEFFNTPIKLKFNGEYIDNGNLEKQLKLINVINGNYGKPKKKAKTGKYFHEFVSNIMMTGCENVNSGIDKGAPKKQLENLNIVNAFGSTIDEITNKEKGIAGKSRYDEKRLKFLKELGNQNFTFEINPIAIRKYIMDEIKDWYSSILSDSRFPINDITLWDQAYMTASLFKATLAAMSLEKEKYNNYKQPRSIKWSIMGIQYDKLGLAEKAMNPAFIKWYRNYTDEVDVKIKKLLEEKYALGNEIYRDETGIYFIVPENIIVDNNESESNICYLDESLFEIKDEIMKCFKDFNGEIFPSIFLTKPSRGTMNIAYLLENAKENFLKPTYPKWNDFKEYLGGEDARFKDICDVCGIRLGDKKKNDLKLCGICFQRDKESICTGELQDKYGKNKETIWTGELQDKHGKIALVTLKFELAQWLNGNMLNMMISNENKDEWIDGIKKEIKYIIDIVQNNEQEEKCFKDVKKSYVSKIACEKDLNGTIKGYLESILLHRTIGDKWEELLIKKLGETIDFNKMEIDWERLDNNTDNQTFLAQLLLQFIIRKNPSPARFRRIWESTKSFFNEIERNMESVFQIPSWRSKRIKFNNIVGEEHRSKEFEYREFEYHGLNFILDTNDLYLISSIEQAIPFLRKDDSSYDVIYAQINQGGVDWIKNSIIISDMENDDKYEVNLRNAEYISYSPFISIITPTPISWQFIIPAEYAENVIDYVKNEYDKCFKYVKGKLPLHIGMVFQGYKKPLYIGIKALRNIRRDIDNWNGIKKSISGRELKEMFKSHEQDDMDEYKKRFYSLFQEINEGEKEGRNCCIFHLPDENNEDQTIILKDIYNLDDSKNYAIYPNTLDFQYMDVNIRRNDINYENKLKQNIYLRENRPYILDEWTCFKRFREYFKPTKENSKYRGNSDETKNTKRSTRLQSMVSLIYTKLNDWEDQEGLKDFMISAFINTFELYDEEKKQKFAEIFAPDNWESLKAKDGEEFRFVLYKFLDMYDFWHNCLNEI